MPTRRELTAMFCAGVGLTCAVAGMAGENLSLLIGSVFWAVTAVFHKLPWTKGE